MTNISLTDRSVAVLLHRSTVFNVGSIFDPAWASSATAGESLISLWASWTLFHRIDQNRLRADVLATVCSAVDICGHEIHNCVMLNPRSLQLLLAGLLQSAGG